jgi:hypothetical protein
MNDKKQCQEIIDQFHNKTFPSLFFSLSLNNNQSMKNIFSSSIDFNDKAVQVKFADASKNKKLYKTGLDVSRNDFVE